MRPAGGIEESDRRKMRIATVTTRRVKPAVICSSASSCNWEEGNSSSAKWMTTEQVLIP